MVFSSSVSFLFADNQGSEGPKKFTVEVVASASADSLPKAHTCFNRIDLPVYSSFEEVRFQGLGMAPFVLNTRPHKPLQCTHSFSSLLTPPPSQIISTQKQLETKLLQAVENSIGFGIE